MLQKKIKISYLKNNEEKWQWMNDKWTTFFLDFNLVFGKNRKKQNKKNK